MNRPTMPLKPMPARRPSEFNPRPWILLTAAACVLVFFAGRNACRPCPIDGPCPAKEKPFPISNCQLPIEKQPQKQPAAATAATRPEAADVSSSQLEIGNGKLEIDFALDIAWWAETKNGTDLTYYARQGEPGPDGELGEYQITPIFQADLDRLGIGRIADPTDNAECRRKIAPWMEHYAATWPATIQRTPQNLYKLFHLGPGTPPGKYGRATGVIAWFVATGQWPDPCLGDDQAGAGN